MSPQMNGEPRDEELRASNRAPETARAASSAPAPAADRPLPPALNTAGVSKTATQSHDEESDQLAPLFTEGASADFRRRWDLVQRGFVDDPREAVHAADELVTEVTKTLSESFASHRLERGGAEVPTTENLRIALRRYRAFFERLLSI